jgi:RNA polymerase sigma-70 factor (ECF subfamily)
MTDLRQSEFVKLLTEHQMALRCFILSMLPGCQDVEDVLQDTNVVLWEKMMSYEPGTNFRAWAFTVARNKVMQYRDHESRANRIVLSEVLLDAIEDARGEIPPDALEGKLNALNQCLALLSIPERNLIRMRYAEQGKEKLALLQRPAASVRVALCRIRGKLRECVERRIRWRDLRA